jgi:hypothetical protein
VKRLVGALAEVGRLLGSSVDADLVFRHRIGNVRHGRRCHRLARQTPGSAAPS